MFLWQEDTLGFVPPHGGVKGSRYLPAFAAPREGRAMAAAAPSGRRRLREPRPLPASFPPSGGGAVALATGGRRAPAPALPRGRGLGRLAQSGAALGPSSPAPEVRAGQSAAGRRP